MKRFVSLLEPKENKKKNQNMLVSSQLIIAEEEKYSLIGLSASMDGHGS
jgi:hypothetical protein